MVVVVAFLWKDDRTGDSAVSTPRKRSPADAGLHIAGEVTLGLCFCADWQTSAGERKERTGPSRSEVAAYAVVGSARRGEAAL